nr:uncharacterized protein LOC104092494 [Nicotiana tomentosiformis]
MMLLPVVPDEWAAEAFTKGLSPRSSDAFRKLKESLLEFQAITWADVHNRYESKIRIEDGQLDFPASPEGRDRGFWSAYRFVTDRRTDRGRINRSLKDKETSGSRDSSYPRLSKYNFNVSVVELVSAMRNNKEVMFSKTMRSDPSQRDPNLWCKYHGTNDHRTEDCRHLREEVATLLKIAILGNSYVTGIKTIMVAGKNPSRVTINMIFGGNKINGVTFSVAKKTKVLLPTARGSGKLLKTTSPSEFGQYYTIEGIGESQAHRKHHSSTKPLTEFNLASATTRREILLPMNVEGVMKTTLFEVVDDDMGYNIISGRPWLHEMKNVPSTYHQLLKFPTPEGIK